MSGRSRGVALVNALVVVAALAAISAALLIRADQARQRQGLRLDVDQVSAYLRAGQDQALTELEVALANRFDQPLMPGQDWDRPRAVPIDRGRVAWVFADLHGRFNLSWLADEGPLGEMARLAFARLAAAQGLPAPLIARLIRAAGPDGIARASALGSARAPDLPLASPRLLGGVVRPAEGGAEALAPLWPLLAALPTEAGFNPETAPIEVLQALLPEVEPDDWPGFEAAREAGVLALEGGVAAHAARYWPPSASETLAMLPMVEQANWFDLSLEARLDSRVLRRSAVVALRSDADPVAPVAPSVRLSLPLVE